MVDLLPSIPFSARVPEKKGDFQTFVTQEHFNQTPTERKTPKKKLIERKYLVKFI